MVCKVFFKGLFFESFKGLPIFFPDRSLRVLHLEVPRHPGRPVKKVQSEWVLLLLLDTFSVGVLGV